MKKLWKHIKKVWQDFFIEDDIGYFRDHLNPSDNRRIIFWAGILAFCMLTIFLVAVRLSEQRMLNTIAAYIASATTAEYDEITWEVRYHLVYKKFGHDVEKYVQYIPNTAENCPTCQEYYHSQAYLACVNTGVLYALDVFVESRKPEDHYGEIQMSSGFDEVSQSGLTMIRVPDDRINTIELRREGGIVSIHRMKTLFCDNCINEILMAVEDKPVSEFVIFDTERKVFYPIEDRMMAQIGDYILEVRKKDRDYEITVRYTAE